MPARQSPLLESLLALRAELEGPGLTVKQAASQFENAEQALEFVRRDIAFIQYPGCWAGPDGSLRLGAANSQDKVALLAALLERLDYQVEFYSAPWPKGVTAPNAKSSDFDYSEWQERINSKLSRLKQVLSELSPELATKTKVDKRTIDLDALRDQLNRSYKVIESQFSQKWLEAKSTITKKPARWFWLRARKKTRKTTPKADPSMAIQEVQTHQSDPADWQIFDPVFAKLPRPKEQRPETKPESQSLSIRIDTVSKTGHVDTLSEWQGKSSDALGHDIHYMILPSVHHAGDLDKMTTPDEIELWRSFLRVGPSHSQSGKSSNVDRNGAFSRLGTVIHRKGQKVYAGKGLLFDHSVPAPERFHAPELKTAEVANVDSSDYPLIHVDLVLPAKQNQKTARWHPSHFDLRLKKPSAQDTDEKNSSTRLPIEIELAPTPLKPVVFVVDVSCSMRSLMDKRDVFSSRITATKTAIQQVLSRLSPEQLVTVAGFEAGIVMKHGPHPAGDKKFWAQLGRKLTLRNAETLPEALVESLSLSADQSAHFFVLSDGVDERTFSKKKAIREQLKQAHDLSLRKLAERHKTFGAEFSFLGLGEASAQTLAQYADASKGHFQQFHSKRDIVNYCASSASKLSGKLRIAFIDPLAKKNARIRKRSANLKIANFPKDLQVTWKVSRPKAEQGVRNLKLTIQFGDSTGKNLSFSRLLQKIGPKVDPWSLISDHHFLISTGRIGRRIELARLIDKVIDSVKIATKPVKEIQEWSCDRGAAPDLVTCSNRSLELLEKLCQTELGWFRWSGPQIVGLSRRGLEKNGAHGVELTFDTLNCSLGCPQSVPRKLRIRRGLALGLVEAEVLESKNPSQPIIDCKKVLKFNRHSVRKIIFEPESLAYSEFRRLSYIICNPDDVTSIWSVDRDGELKVIVRHRGQFRSVRSEAKGATVEEVGAKFARLRRALKIISAFYTAFNGPNGAVVSALIGLYTESLKLWCFSTTMLMQVNDSIAGQELNVDAAKKRSAKACETSTDVAQQATSIYGGAIGGAIGSELPGAVAKDLGKLAKASKFAQFYDRYEFAIDPAVKAAADWYNPIPDQVNTVSVNLGHSAQKWAEIQFEKQVRKN